MSHPARAGAETRRRRCEVTGFTAVPRWTLNPVPGAGEHKTAIPAELVAALRQLAKELDVPLSSVLLTAHAKVLGTLSGEREVCTGYAANARSPRPLRVTLGPRSWRETLRGTARAESDLVAHRDVSEPSFETVFEHPAGDGGELDEGVVLRVAFVEHGGLVLRLRYKTDVLDADCAASIAGYHLTALALIAADPNAEHARQTLLSAEELRFQIDGLAGPQRELPDARAHELFEERARARPDAIAAVRGNTQWTYGELNARANRLARALLARGLCCEGVVGVVTERNLDWMAAVLAIFKAGGAYLPIEPHFPADRIARTLSRAGCRLVLTERGSTATLDQALASLSGVEKLFIDKITGGRVNVIQVVPSYLEVVLTYLEQVPRELPDLRCVSVTGEALKKELVQRWFAAKPGITLVNAYGLTETSDDTNHEVMHSVPRRDRVPLGRPINNVRIYIVDEHLSPVPLGAPGEIVFAGVCVGRGYINDPERTRRALLPDPHRERQRLS